MFAAATTNVEYTLRVTDSETGAVAEYLNPLGVSTTEDPFTFVLVELLGRGRRLPIP